MAQSPRDAQKARYADYQARARTLAQAVNRTMDQEIVQVSVQPTVWETEEGAFVECVIWIPREARQ